VSIEIAFEGGPHDGLSRSCDVHPRAELMLPADESESPRPVLYRLVCTEVRGANRPGPVLRYRFERYAGQTRPLSGAAFLSMRTDSKP